MSEIFPVVYLARHGETAWSITGQHTGLTDLPLTERGESNARKLGLRLTGIPFARVFTSPLQRAVRTCELAGFAHAAELDPDLVEWNYGRYEAGLRWTSFENVQTGSCSAMVVRGESRHSKLLSERIALCSGYELWREMFCFSPAVIFFEC